MRGRGKRQRESAAGILERWRGNGVARRGGGRCGVLALRG